MVKPFVEGAEDPDVLHSGLGGEQTDGGRRAQVEKDKDFLCADSPLTFIHFHKIFIATLSTVKTFLCVSTFPQ